METTLTVSSKGQITLPSKIRRGLNISAGDKIRVIKKSGYISLVPETFEQDLKVSRIKLQKELKSKGINKSKISAFLDNYQAGDGWEAHVKN